MRSKKKVFWLPHILIGAAIVIAALVLLHTMRTTAPETSDASSEQTEILWMYAVDDAEMLDDPHPGANVMKNLYYQQKVRVIGETDGYYQVELEKIGGGYVKKEFLTAEAPKLPDERDTHWACQREGLEIDIRKYEEENLVYWVAEVYTENPERDINTAFSGNGYEDSFETHKRTSQIAREQGAVFAVNGDEVGFRGSKDDFRNPIVIRNGTLYYEDDRDIGEMCALRKDGKLNIFSPGDLGTGEEMVKAGITDVWWFDCALVKNGEIPQELIEAEESFEPAPYTAIGQKDKNHFLFIVADGRGSNGSDGVTYTGMARLMKKYGAVTAYELDGGGSSTIWFDGMVLNKPSDGVERKISDIIYVK